MTDVEAITFIEEVLGGYWSDWEFTKFETGAWIERLTKFDFNHAKKAVKKFYFEQKTERKKPAAGRLMVALVEGALIKENVSSSNRTATLFQIFRKNGVARWFPFSDDASMAQQEIEAMALNFTMYANRLEPGHYYVLCSDDEVEGYSGDPALSITARRAQARDKAFDDIINGDDTKTRRWLENYLIQKHKKEDREKKEPVRVGEVIKI